MYDLFNMPDVSKGKGNENSIEAFAKLNCGSDREKIYNLINGSLSTYEIGLMLGKAKNEISGRFSELKIKRYIYLVGKKKHNGNNFFVYGKTGKPF